MKATTVLFLASSLLLSGAANAGQLFKNVEQASQALVYDAVVQTSFEIDNQIASSFESLNNSIDDNFNVELASQSGVTYEQSEAEKAD